MWSLVPRKAQLTLLIGLGILATLAYDAAISHLTGHAPPWYRSLAFAVFAVGTVFALVANFIWRWVWRWVPFLQTAIFPDLNGEWSGHLVSTWVDPSTGKSPAPIATKVTIKQTLFSFSVTLQTGESRSHSTRVFLEAFKDERRFRVWYSYNNDPLAQVQHRSSPHEGVAYLDVHFDDDKNRLTGRYYTARKTTGDLDLRR